MRTMTSAVATVDAYIAAAPLPAQPMLAAIREVIREAAPSAVEKIAYGMPAYEYRGASLVHVAATRRHVAVYGLVHVEGDVPQNLAPYLHHRSTLQFHYGEPLPADALAAAIRRKATSG